MIRLLKGFFGSVEPYALLGFESVPIGPITGPITFAGQVNSGGCSFGTAIFGSRL
jgi:hypothetical protein